jgi:hypothetical protein
MVHKPRGLESGPVATYLAVNALVTFIAVCLVSKKDRVAIIANAIPAEATI